MRLISDMLSRVVNRLRREEGQTLVEYALIVGLVSIAAIVVMITMGDSIEAVFTAIANELGSVSF